MKTFASLFSGGGGADIGARQAGLKPIWGIEYIEAIAEWYERNIGHKPIVQSVLTVNFRRLIAPWWLHMSPPCVTASSANSKAGESLMDMALAAACIRAIEELNPEWVSLENVAGYRHYASYKSIKETLVNTGYKVVEAVLNCADYGVPQTRKRLILIASRDAIPVLPFPTHSEHGDMFTQKWEGWHQAIADLVATLPPSKLAAWQLKRLPPLVVAPGNPARALLINSSSSMEVRSDNAPSAVLVSSPRTLDTKVVLLFETRQGSRLPTMCDSDTPAPTAHTEPARYKVVEDGRVLRLTPEALGRLQGLTDYQYPTNRVLAGRIVGNMVPPLLMQRVIEAQSIALQTAA